MSRRRAFRLAASRPTRAFAAAACLCLSACLFGGTGTDTENGITENAGPNSLHGIYARVTDSAGRPLSGVSLAFFDPAYRPDLGQLPEAVVANRADSLVSDSGGYVRLTLKAAGKFVVEGVSQGKILFFDTLAVPDLEHAAIYPFRARASLAFKGKVKLTSGLRIDSGRVFIRGTGRMARVDSAGGYDLGLLPSDAERMALGVRFVSSPVSVLRATPAPLSVVDTLGESRYACKVLTGDSATKAANPLGMSSQTETPTKLDTAVVNPVLQSCGPLQAGTVISITTVKSPSGGSTPASQGTTLLVLKGPDTTNYTSPKVLAPVVAPISQCVPALGTESTSYALDVGAGDIIVEDLSASCQAP